MVDIIYIWILEWGDSEFLAMKPEWKHHLRMLLLVERVISIDIYDLV